MQNLTVTDCEGVLTDSEMGPEPGQYDHNEDYTFTICVEGADELVLTFDFFSTEENYDILTIHRGDSRSGPVITTLSGSIQPPPVVVIDTGCITLHFVSDDNIVARGWQASWNIEVEEPEAPALSLVSMLDCPMESIIFEFDEPIDCDQFVAGNFTILGPGGRTVSSVSPLDCDAVSNTATRFEVFFNQQLGEAGNYRLLFNGQIQDACGEWHDVSTNIPFTLNNCPILVDILEVTDACAGDCGTVRAEITGTQNNQFRYEWSHTGLDQEEVSVCTEDSLLISVTVTDLVSGEMASNDYWYFARPLPAILNPLSGDTVCASRGDHWYDVDIGGGEFYGNRIPGGNRTNGRYQFWRWDQETDLNQEIVTYIAPNGCETQDSFWVWPVRAWPPQAVCLGTAPFQVSSGTPVGGFWGGSPKITPQGIFTPDEVGEFWVFYEAQNGCQAWKRITVADGITMPDVDTICGYNPYNFSAEPRDGLWSGPGIVNARNGRVEPWRITPDTTYQYIYTLNGCSDTIDVFVQELYAGVDQTICLSDTLVFLEFGGDWRGPGTYIDSIPAFNISGLGPGEYEFTLYEAGCTDEIIVRVEDVDLTLDQTLFFCLEDNEVYLEDYISRNPGGGALSGPGVIEVSDEFYFNPIRSGPGLHPLVLSALNCTDTLWIEVQGDALIQDYQFCERSEAIVLEANPSGGTWSGPGILDGQLGLFDPQSLGVGSYEIFYTSPSGCVTLDTIDIFLFTEVEISGIEQQYCSLDTFITFSVSPPGGNLTINGTPADSSFNPVNLGVGNHEVIYSRGTGACASSDRQFFSVLQPIEGVITAADDSICVGQNTEIRITTSGGVGNLQAIWDQGLGFGNSHIVNPEGTTQYTVEVSDGCSEPLQDTLEVFVFPEFPLSVSYGPEVCFTDTTWAEVLTPDPTNYEVNWQASPPFAGPRFTAEPGLYGVNVVELFSGCRQSLDVELPGAPPLSANFSVIPNQDCIDIIENQIELIDLSQGYDLVNVSLGDGNMLTFGPGHGLLEHAYADTGQFEIVWVVENYLGCIDSMRQWICVENRVEIFVPNIFTPNQDGENDFFSITSFGIDDVTWRIFDRHGEMMFQSNSLEDRWDGTFRGRIMDPGVFVVQLLYTDRSTGERGSYYGSLTLIR